MANVTPVSGGVLADRAAGTGGGAAGVVSLATRSASDARHARAS
ncbi:hypothetical protein [Halarchaeum nitratireducens]|nr:hypothetical protein [Halarchaeum nitratireducens]MBP2250887.1 hypothetical protein [Halarchaeum solikamskense]